LHREAKAALRRPPLALRPLPLRSAVQDRSGRRLVIVTKAVLQDLMAKLGTRPLPHYREKNQQTS
jgi:hypothetical protein